MFTPIFSVFTPIFSVIAPIFSVVTPIFSVFKKFVVLYVNKNSSYRQSYFAVNLVNLKILQTEKKSMYFFEKLHLKIKIENKKPRT